MFVVGFKSKILTVLILGLRFVLTSLKHRLVIAKKFSPLHIHVALIDNKFPQNRWNATARKKLDNVII